VDLLLLLHERIILRDTTQSKFIHEIDLIRVAHVFVLIWINITGTCFPRERCSINIP